MMHPRHLLISASLTAALALAACSSKGKPQIDENLFPADYRNAILNTVMTSKLMDPTNIREASITDPFLKPVPGGGATRYVVCTRFNARDSMRQYMGVAEYVAYFYAGDLTQFVKPTGDVCAGAAYKPFPELEKVCLGDKCS